MIRDHLGAEVNMSQPLWLDWETPKKNVKTVGNFFACRNSLRISTTRNVTGSMLRQQETVPNNNTQLMIVATTTRLIYQSRSPLPIQLSQHSTGWHLLCLVDEWGNSERWRDYLKSHSSDSRPMSSQTLPHHKSSFCPGSLRPWLQVRPQVSLLPGFGGRDSRTTSRQLLLSDATVPELHLSLWTSAGLH